MHRYSYPLNENEKQLPLYICSFGEKKEQSHIGPTPDFQCYYHMLYTYNGCGYVKLSDYEGELPEGTGFLLSPYEPREYYPVSKKPWHTKWITFGGDFAAPLINLIPGKRNGKFDITNKIMLQKKMSAITKCINDDNFSESSAHLVFDLLLSLRHCITFEPDDEMYNIYKHRLEPLIEYLSENFTDEFDLDAAAKLIGCSPVHLCKMFRKVYNMRPNEYITILRVKNARDLLISKLNLTVAQIGQISGYQSPSYFSQKFRQHTGMTPMEFRENYVSLTAFGIKETDIPQQILETLISNKFTEK